MEGGGRREKGGRRREEGGGREDWRVRESEFLIVKNKNLFIFKVCHNKLYAILKSK